MKSIKTCFFPQQKTEVSSLCVCPCFGPGCFLVFPGLWPLIVPLWLYVFWSLCRAHRYDGWFPNKNQVWGAGNRKSTSLWWMDQSAESAQRGSHNKKILLTKTHTNTHTQQEYKIPLVAFGKKRKHKVSPVYDVFFWTNAIVEKRVSLLGKILQKIKVKLILVHGLGLD